MSEDHMASQDQSPGISGAALTDVLVRMESAEVCLSDENLGRLLCAVHGEPFGRTSIRCGDDGSDEFNVYAASASGFLFGGYRHLMPDMSLDAALALLDRFRPALKIYGWSVQLDDEPVFDPFYVRLDFSSDSPCRGPRNFDLLVASAATAPLAVLAALVQALIAANADTSERLPSPREEPIPTQPHPNGEA